MLNRQDFADALNTYCAITSASITSSLRTGRHNAVVGGMPHSAHLYALGADVVYDAPLDRDLAATIAKRLGLLLLRESDHDHLQPLGWEPG